MVEFQFYPHQALDLLLLILCQTLHNLLHQLILPLDPLHTDESFLASRNLLFCFPQTVPASPHVSSALKTIILASFLCIKPVFDRLSIVAPVLPEDEAMLADQSRVVEAPVLENSVNWGTLYAVHCKTNQ